MNAIENIIHEQHNSSKLTSLSYNIFIRIASKYYGYDISNICEFVLNKHKSVDSNAVVSHNNYFLQESVNLMSANFYFKAYGNDTGQIMVKAARNMLNTMFLQDIYFHIYEI